MTGMELLQNALDREQEDQKIYKEYARNTTSQGLVQLLSSLIDQEEEHTKELTELAAGDDPESMFTAEGLASFDVSSYSPKSRFSPDMTVNDFLNHVIDREESGVRFYSAIAGICSDEDLAFTFNNLSFEEQKHKNWAMDRYELEMLSSM